MASAPAALIARARREIQHHFFAQDAVRPDRAAEFTRSNGFERRQFERMRERGIVHTVDGKRYWLDVVAYDTDLRARHMRLRTVLVFVILVLAAAIVFPAVGQFIAQR